MSLRKITRMRGSFPNDVSAEPYPPLSLGPRLWRCPETTETLWKRSAACHIR